MMSRGVRGGILLLIMLVLVSFKEDKVSMSETTVKLTNDEAVLYKLVMEYRRQNGLDTIPLSKCLTYVAHEHCKDLLHNVPYSKNGACNMHSWSDKGNWTGCCYTDDHKNANCMWSKPNEITGYPDKGYEIAFVYLTSSTVSADSNVTPDIALKGWKKSTGHNNVILNKQIWTNVKWNAVGVGMYKGYAVIWFGQTADTLGAPEMP